jgi:hypothetical protein
MFPPEVRRYGGMTAEFKATSQHVPVELLKKISFRLEGHWAPDSKEENEKIFVAEKATEILPETESEVCKFLIDKVFNVGNQVSNSIAKGLTNVVVPIGIAVFLYLLVRMLLASDPKDVQTYKKRLIVVAIIVVAAVAVPGLMKVANELGGQINGELGGNNIGG